MYVEVRPKHNLTMVSDASPGTADPKMNKSFVHTAQMSPDRACAQDGAVGNGMGGIDVPAKMARLVKSLSQE